MCTAYLKNHIILQVTFREWIQWAFSWPRSFEDFVQLHKFCTLSYAYSCLNAVLMLPHSTCKETNFSVGSAREPATMILPADSYYSHTWSVTCVMLLCLELFPSLSVDWRWRCQCHEHYWEKGTTLTMCRGGLLVCTHFPFTSGTEMWHEH